MKSPKAERAHIIINNWCRIILWTSLWTMFWWWLGFDSKVAQGGEGPTSLFSDLLRKPYLIAASFIATGAIGAVLHTRFGSFHFNTWVVHPSHMVAALSGLCLAFWSESDGSPLVAFKLLLGFYLVAIFMSGVTTFVFDFRATRFMPSGLWGISSSEWMSHVDRGPSKALRKLQERDGTSSVGNEEFRESDEQDGSREGVAETSSNYERMRLAELRAWLASDDPIENVAESVFPEHEYVAELIVDGIDKWIAHAGNKKDGTPNFSSGHADSAMLLDGDEGTGKSSILKMVENEYAAHPYVSFCNCYAGEYAGQEAFVRGILDSIIGEVRRFGDVMPLSGLPARAWCEVGGVQGNLLATLFSRIPSASMSDQLLRLDQILISMDRFVVLCVQDVERFLGGDIRGQVKPDLAPTGRAEVQRIGMHSMGALLMQINDLSRVTFILAGPKWAAQVLDVAKLTRFEERVPLINDTDLKRLVCDMRNGWLEKACSVGGLVPFGPHPSSEIGVGSAPTGWVPWSHRCEILGMPEDALDAICNGLRTSPRQVKYVLRRHGEIWERLRGEVDHDDLLVLNVLEHFAPRSHHALAAFHERLVDGFRCLVPGYGLYVLQQKIQTHGESTPNLASPPEFHGELHMRVRQAEKVIWTVGHEALLEAGYTVPNPSFGSGTVDGAKLEVIQGLLCSLFAHVEADEHGGSFPSSAHRIRGFRPQGAMGSVAIFRRMLEKRSTVGPSTQELLGFARSILESLTSGDSFEVSVKLHQVAELPELLGPLSVVYNRAQWLFALQWCLDQYTAFTDAQRRQSSFDPAGLLQAVLVKRGWNDLLHPTRVFDEGGGLLEVGELNGVTVDSNGRMGRDEADRISLDPLLASHANFEGAESLTPVNRRLIQVLRDLDFQERCFHRLDLEVWKRWGEQVRSIPVEPGSRAALSTKNLVLEAVQDVHNLRSDSKGEQPEFFSDCPLLKYSNG